jgi:hypothetical protein
MIGGRARRSRRLFRDMDVTEKVGALIPTGGKLAILPASASCRRWSHIDPTADECRTPKQQRRDRSKARAQLRRGKTMAQQSETARVAEWWRGKAPIGVPSGRLMSKRDGEIELCDDYRFVPAGFGDCLETDLARLIIVRLFASSLPMTIKRRASDRDRSPSWKLAASVAQVAPPKS